jgi:hypothetical protein
VDAARCYGSSFSFIEHPAAGKPYDVVDVAGGLLVSQDTQDRVGLRMGYGRTLARAPVGAWDLNYRSMSGMVSMQAIVIAMGNSERKCRLATKRGMDDKDSGSMSASNASRLSSLPWGFVFLLVLPLFVRFFIVFIGLDA